MVRYWVVRMTMNSLDSTSLDWEIGKNKNFVGIGSSRAGDLIGYTTKEELRGKLNKAYKPETSGTLNNWVSHYISFINRIERNDIVVLPIYPEHAPDFKKYIVGIVRTPPYYIKEPQDNARAAIRRDVVWLIEMPKEKFSDRLNKSLESPHKVYNIDKHEREIKALLKGKS